MEIREFIEARLIEDERLATLALDGPWLANTGFMQEFNPGRALREVAAKRAVIADLDRARAQQKQHPKDLATTGWVLGMMRALDFLALAWEDHPDFDPAWRING